MLNPVVKQRLSRLSAFHLSVYRYTHEERAARGPAQNQRLYTGLNLNSTRTPLT